MYKPIVERVIPEFVKKKKRQNVFTERKYRGAKTKDWILTNENKKQEWKGERMLRTHMIRDTSGMFSEEKFVMLRSTKNPDGSTRYEMTPVSGWYQFNFKNQRPATEMSMEEIDAIMKGKMEVHELRVRTKPGDDDDDDEKKPSVPTFTSYRSAFKDPSASKQRVRHSDRYGEIDQGSDGEEVEGMVDRSDDEQEDVMQYNADGDDTNVFEALGSEFDSELEEEDEDNKSGSGSDSDLMDEDVELDDGSDQNDGNHAMKKNGGNLNAPSRVSRKTSTAKDFLNNISGSSRRKKRPRSSSPAASSSDDEEHAAPPPPTKRMKKVNAVPVPQSDAVKLDNAIRDILIRYGKPIDLKTIMKELKKAGLRPSKKKEPQKFSMFIKMIGKSLPRVAEMEKIGGSNCYKVKRMRRV